MDAKSLLGRQGQGIGGPVARGSMRDTIAQRLAALIGSGAVCIGDPLPSERELAAAMGVSRETVRSALLILSTHGIVQVMQGARTTVVSDDVSELAIGGVLTGAAAGSYTLDEIHEGRLLVEARISHLVVRKLSAERLLRLTGMIKAQRSAMDDPVRYLILDREFHTLIYRACGNRVLSDLATTLYSYLMEYRRRVVARPGAIARSIEDHHAILSALERRDGGELAAAFGVHECRIYETTRQMLELAGMKTAQGGNDA